MNSDAWGSLIFAVFLGSIILTPIVLRNRLLARQLDALTVAMQQGIEPERVRESLMLRRDEGDVNGNWKAGLILTALGWIFLPFSLLALFAAVVAQKADLGGLVGMLPGIACIVLGARLQRIHKTIVGDVVKRSEGTRDAEAHAQGEAPSRSI